MKLYAACIRLIPENLPRKAMMVLLWPSFLFLFVSRVDAQQAPDQVYQDWYFMEESQILMDVATRVIECGGTDYIQVQVFNEQGYQQVANFTLTATNPANGDQAVFSFNKQVPAAEIWEPDCSMQVYPDLMWPLPAGFDPGAVTFTIVFN